MLVAEHAAELRVDWRMPSGIHLSVGPSCHILIVHPLWARAPGNRRGAAVGCGRCLAIGQGSSDDHEHRRNKGEKWITQTHEGKHPGKLTSRATARDTHYIATVAVDQVTVASTRPGRNVSTVAQPPHNGHAGAGPSHLGPDAKIASHICT